jgi:hypothetical protein
MHGDVRKPPNNVDGNDITIQGEDTLKPTSDLDRMVIDIILIMLKLSE